MRMSNVARGCACWALYPSMPMNEALRAYLAEDRRPITVQTLRNVLRQEIPEYLATMRSIPTSKRPSAKK
jgi:hypothetical protein